MIQFKPEHFKHVYVPITVLEDAIQAPAGDVRAAAKEVEERSLAAASVGLYCVQDVLKELPDPEEDE